MKTSLIPLFFLPLVLSQNSTVITSLTPILPTESTTESYEYVVKLVFGLEHDKIPEYIVDAILDYSNNVTSADVVLLYNLEYWSLNTTIDVLKNLSYNPYDVLSVTGLEKYLIDFGMDFKDFYNNVILRKLQIAGLPLMNFLTNLGINTGEFSNAMTYGVGDPLQIFKAGNFSEENLNNALQGVDVTEDKLFESCKEEVLDSIKLKPREEVIALLKKYRFGKVEALKLWAYLLLTDDDINNVHVFNHLINDLKFDLESNVYLGVLTSEKVVINRHIFNHIRDQFEISKIFAQSIYDNVTVELKEDKPYYDNIATLSLQSNYFTNFIEVGTTAKDLEDCSIITLENDILTKIHIERVLNKGDVLEVSLDGHNYTDLVIIPGSPLICNHIVYGLAKEPDETNTIFDTFVIHSTSGVPRILFNPFYFVSLFLFYFSV